MLELQQIFKKHQISISKPIILIYKDEVTVLTVKSILERVVSLGRKQRHKMLSNFSKVQNDKRDLLNYTERIGMQMIKVKL